jgi:hypothetical protein
MRSSRKPLLLGALLLLAPGLRGDAGRRPEWIAHPKSDDSLCLYRVGTAVGQPDPVTARQKALAAAGAVIADELLARAGVPGAQRRAWEGRLDLHNIEPTPGAVHIEDASDGTVTAWVQVSFPLADKAAVLARIEQETRIVAGIVNARLAARRHLQQGDYHSARTNLEAALVCGSATPVAAVEREETLLLLGDVCAAQKDFFAARQAYDELNRPEVNETWRRQAVDRQQKLPKPPRAWPLRGRWSGRRVAVLCARREAGAALRPFPALSGVLRRELGEARLDTQELQLPSADITAWIDERRPEAAGLAARQAAAQIVVAAVLTTDPSRRGKTETVMGIELPVADSQVAFAVLDVSRDSVLYDGSFREMAGEQSDQRLSERVAGILIDKYLVPRCPAIDTPPPDQAP